MEAGTGASWLSEYHWDHLFDNPPHVDTPSTALQQLEVVSDAAEWASWDDLFINGCSVNNLSGEYLMDAELQDESNNIEEDHILSHRKDTIIFQHTIDSADTITSEQSGVIPRDQLVSDYTATDRSRSESIAPKKADSSSVDVDHGSVEYKGLRLLHLLTACVEAMSEGAQDLVEVILCRLRQLVSCTGSTMERVAYYLFDALLHSNVNIDSLTHLELDDKTGKEHFFGALKLLHVAYPYIRIPHLTANECILEAVVAAGGGNNVGIHIIDFDIMEGMQWPPLMEALRNNDDVPHLRITAIKWPDEEEDQCLHYSAHTGRRLSEYATSAGIPFSYQERDLKGVKDILSSQEGEIVVVNCMWQLPHMLNLRNKSHLFEFLVSTRHLNPVAVTLATGPHGIESGTANFLESFARRLEELCVIFDSLEAGLPEHGLARATVERIFFGPAMSKRVMSSVRGDDSPADIRDSNVVDLPLRCGYEECSISNDNMIDAKCNVLCSGSSGCYEVEMVGHHRVVLRWGSTPLVCVSAWKPPSSSCISNRW